MLPTRASTSRSWTSFPKRARTNAPIESSISVRGRNGSAAARNLPCQLSRSLVTNGRIDAGTPNSTPLGMSCRPLCHTAARASVGDVRSVRPTRRANSTACGTRVRKASAPSSMCSTPANGDVAIFPPSMALDSHSSTLSVGSSTRSIAAARPAIPPPTTRTRRSPAITHPRRHARVRRVRPSRLRCRSRRQFGRNEVHEYRHDGRPRCRGRTALRDDRRRIRRRTR